MFKMTLKTRSIILVPVLFLLNSTAESAITIDVGPTYAPPGLGVESVTGAPDVSGGMTISYTGMDLSQTQNLYFGIRRDLWPNGFSSDGSEITPGETFIFTPPPIGGNTLNYHGYTTIETLTQGPTTMPTWMVMTFHGFAGSPVYDSTTVSYDVGAMWHVLSDFSVTIEMFAQVVQEDDPNFGNWEPARELYDRLDCPATGCAGTGSSVDWGFYYESLVDTDNDGVPDPDDNCTLVPNSPQRDTDSDGFGNYCDPDFNNDNIVNAADLAFFKPKFFSNDPDADLNGDGVVNAADLAILKTMFFQAPGPSGLVLP